MFELVQKSSIRSDCTASFDVKMDKPYTVDLFIDEVLSTRPEVRADGGYSRMDYVIKLDE